MNDQFAVAGIAPRQSKTKMVWLIVTPLLILLAGETIWGSSALLTAPPMWANLVCISVGIGYFYYWIKLAEKIHHERNEFRQMNFWGKFSLILFLPAFFMPYFLRLGIEIFNFSFFETSNADQNFLIVGTNGIRSWGNWVLVVSRDGDGRETRVKVTPHLHNQYRHIDTLGKDCLALPTQKGRWGVIRVLRPTYGDTPVAANLVQKDCRNTDGTSMIQTSSN